MRLKCIKRPTQDGHMDTQVSPGKWYDIQATTESMGTGEIFYTIKGDDGILIDRAARWFSKPEKMAKCKKNGDVSLARVDDIEQKYPKSDWIYEVTNGDTVLGYNEWVDHMVESEG